jgi:hypothetical protein
LSEVGKKLKKTLKLLSNVLILIIEQTNNFAMLDWQADRAALIYLFCYSLADPVQSWACLMLISKMTMLELAIRFFSENELVADQLGFHCARETFHCIAT